MNYYLLIEYKEQGFVLEMEEYYEFYKSEIFDSYHDFVDIIASFNTSDLFMENFSEHLNLCQKYKAVEKTFLKDLTLGLVWEMFNCTLSKENLSFKIFQNLREMIGLMKIVSLVPLRY